jgi:phosphatidylglycerol:prolipoprotein diacylglycerol transferase
MLLDFIIWDANPEIFRTGTFELFGTTFGPIAVRWYGLLFASGFLIGQQIMFYLFRKDGKPERDVEALTIYVVIATILGARLGHAIFYEPEAFFTAADPFKVFRIWEGGLASHGATITILIALWLYSRSRKGQSFAWIIDRVVITVALGGALIRMGNLMNSEIYGKPANVPWAFVYPLAEGSIDYLKQENEAFVESLDVKQAPGDTSVGNTFYQRLYIDVNFKRGKMPENQAINYATGMLMRGYERFEGMYDNLLIDPSRLEPQIRLEKGRTTVTLSLFGKPRHPSQIYETLFCLLLMGITFWLWSARRYQLPEGFIAATFIILLFSFRFIVEFIKKEQVASEKDMTFNIGQNLSIPAVLFGILLMVWAFYNQKKKADKSQITQAEKTNT